MVKSGDPPVMLISGRSGIGKSSLLARLADECTQQGVVCVEVDCRDPRHGNYQKIMTAIATRLGIEHFQNFVNLVNHFSDPRQKFAASAPNISIHGEVSATTLNAGGPVTGVIIKEVNITVPSHDFGVPEAERIAPLTDRFLADLQPLLTRNTIVFFFDQLENATTETRKWFWEELLRPIRLGGGLDGARFVVCAQESPDLEAEIGDLRRIVKRADLNPLKDGDIAEYLARREGPSLSESDRRVLAVAIFVKTNGIPGEVAGFVDLIHQHRENVARGT